MSHPVMTICQGFVILSLLALGILIILKRRLLCAGRLLSLLCLFCAVWVGTIKVSDICCWHKHLEGALLARSFGKSGVALAMATFVAFTWYFPRPAKQRRSWHLPALFGLALIVAGTSFTPWDALDAEIVGNDELLIEYGFMHHLFIAYVVVTGLIALGTLLVRHTAAQTPLERLQIQYVALGIGISYGTGTVFCLVLPTYFHWEGLFTIGTIAPLAGCLVMAYAIVKYRALEIDVVLDRTFPWLFSSALMLLPFYLLIHFAGEGIRELDNLTLALAATLVLFPLFILTIKIHPFIDRLVQRDYYAMRDAIDGLIEEAGGLIDPVQLVRLVIETTGQVLSVPRVVFLCYREDQGRFALIDTDSERLTGWAPDDPFLSWMADNAVVLERQQLSLRQRHQNIRRMADEYFERVKAEACMTFVSEGRLVGTLNLGRREGRRWALTRPELSLLTRFRGAMTLALENARLHRSELDLREKRVQAEYLARELQDAHEMQESLLPTSPPQVDGLEMAGRCRPAREVGGDFYDYLEMPDHRMSIVLGDVSGKGLKSAMQAVLSSGLLRTMVRAGGPPDAILGQVSNELYTLTDRNMFTALSFAVIDRQDLRLDLVNAGQPYPLLKRDGTIRTLELGGIPLGAFPRSDRPTSTVDLAIGDLLVFFSDGISEASNPDGEMYGLQRLHDLLASAHPELSCSELSRQVWENVETFTGGAVPFDDMTLVLARITA
jgi:serine phosphatase RsbU (regulator of sigma subunit)